jgi:hypothetical protein
MSRITRESFIDQFQSAGGLDAAAVAADASAALEKAGIGTADLHALAGADGKIDTHAELGRLFDLLDRVDHDGHYRSIETRTSGSNAPTVSGDAYDALAKDLATARSRGPAPFAASALAGTFGVPAERIARSSAALASAGLTDVHLTPVEYLNQGDPKWASHPYPTVPSQPGVVRNVGKAGCAPCSLAMADSALRGVATTPDVTADFAVKSRLSGRPGVTGTDTAALAKGWAAAHGLTLTVANSSDQTANADQLAKRLREGAVALVSVGVDRTQGVGHFTDSSHVLLLNGVAVKNGEDWFAVADPGRRDQSASKKHLLGVDAVVVKVPGAANGCGQVWISRSQLEREMHRGLILEKGVQS